MNEHAKCTSTFWIVYACVTNQFQNAFFKFIWFCYIFTSFTKKKKKRKKKKPGGSLLFLFLLITKVFIKFKWILFDENIRLGPFNDHSLEVRCYLKIKY